MNTSYDRGLAVRGALQTWEAPVAVDRLDTFVEPDLCLVQLTRHVAAT